LALRLCDLARHVGGTLEGSPEVRIRGIAGIEEAGEGDLTFLGHPKYKAELAVTKATAVLVAPGVLCPERLEVIRTKDPYGALAKALELFDPGPPELAPGVHASAVVAGSAELGEDVRVGPHAVIEHGVRVGGSSRIHAGVFLGTGVVLGEGCILLPGVYVGRDCVLGNHVRVQPGAVIGSDGFGYAPIDGVLHRIPQLGIVELGDDVEIGANACIDRATMGATRIGRGTKIDNLVQIAHNVAIGENSVLAAQVGIAGSTKVGRGVRFGGQAGLVGHLRIGDGVSIGAQAGVIGDIPPAETVSGYPARPHREALRIEAELHGLSELRRRVRALEEAQERRAKGRLDPLDPGVSEDDRAPG
jgi:UDP-3-O-[3-hydroxymyristoyl] glucosamine N-acyltransferase